LKRLVPAWLAALRKYCGGRNMNTDLFSANLLQNDLPTSLYLRIASALIFHNGVRKSTHEGRNAPVIRALFEKKLVSFSEPVKVLDIGSSLGFDAITTLDIISNFCKVESFTLGDLFTELWYDPSQNMVFDQDGNLLQIMLGNHFVNVNFEFKYRLQKTIQHRNIKYTRKIAAEYRESRPDMDKVVRIPLVYPGVLSNPIFTMKRLNVFEKLNEQYDLIICMNLLQPRYFGEALVWQGINNLTQALRPGGALITGVTDRPRLFNGDQEVSLPEFHRNHHT
jgi:SAM-dependent methyltransferase